MKFSSDALVQIWIAINALAMFAGGAILVAFRRTIDRLIHTDDHVMNRVSELEKDTASLKEWRLNHDNRHIELVTEIRDMKNLLLRLVTKDFGHGANEGRPITSQSDINAAS